MGWDLCPPSCVHVHTWPNPGWSAPTVDQLIVKDSSIALLSGAGEGYTLIPLSMWVSGGSPKCRFSFVL